MPSLPTLATVSLFLLKKGYPHTELAAFLQAKPGHSNWSSAVVLSILYSVARQICLGCELII